MTTPAFGFPFPSLSDPPNVPAHMEALAESVDTSMARMVQLEGGTATAPAAVLTTITNYGSAYGQTGWADQVSGQVTAPAAGIYHLSSKVRVQPPDATYDVNNTIRDATGALSSQWVLAMPLGLGDVSVGTSVYLHLAAGQVVWQAVYVAGFSGSATVESGVLTVRLVLPD